MFSANRGFSSGEYSLLGCEFIYQAVLVKSDVFQALGDLTITLTQDPIYAYLTDVHTGPRKNSFVVVKKILLLHLAGLLMA